MIAGIVQVQREGNRLRDMVKNLLACTFIVLFGIAVYLIRRLALALPA